MKNKIRIAFDSIKADKNLAEKTKQNVLKAVSGYKPKAMNALRFGVSCAACLLILAATGSWLFFVPTVCISIDINPSFELSVNRFDKVVSVESYNEDGKALIEALDIKYLSCYDAIDKIVKSEEIAVFLEDNDTLEIGVFGSDNAQTERLLSQINSCTGKSDNTYCYFDEDTKSEVAHKLGLSKGKYRAYEKLTELGIDVDVMQIRDMSMREIRELIAEFDDADNKNDCPENTLPACKESVTGKRHNYGKHNEE